MIAGSSAAVLDGRLSTDADGDTLTYAWKVVTSSNGVTPTILNATKSLASLNASTAGVYMVELKVGDGAATDTDYVIVTVRGNQPPVADLSRSDKVVMLGNSAKLDGTNSTDPDGDALTFQWSIVATSNGIAPVIGNPAAAVTTMVGQAVGYYGVQLSVRDAVAIDTKFLLVNVIPNPGIVVGDFNANGAIEASDYAVWRATVGSTSDLRADGNGNGQVDSGDFVHYRKFQGQSVAAAMGLASSSFVAAQPEASSVAVDLTTGAVAPVAPQEPSVVDQALSAWFESSGLVVDFAKPKAARTVTGSVVPSDSLLLALQASPLAKPIEGLASAPSLAEASDTEDSDVVEELFAGIGGGATEL